MRPRLLVAMTLGMLVMLPAPAGAAGPGVAARDLREAGDLLTQGRLREAETTLRRAVTRRPRDAQAWLWLGIVHAYAGDHAGAAQAFESAARLAPRDAVVLLWSGHALARVGRSAEAATTFRRALLAPASPKVHELALQALRAVHPPPKLPADRPSGPAAPAWVTTVQSYQELARHYNPRMAPEEARRIAEAILGYSYRFNVDPRLVVALVVIESGFQPQAISRAGALGLGQLMPGTARGLGVDPRNPVQNLYGTIRYLRSNLDHFGWENAHLALAAYNAGRAAVERYEGVPPYDETRWYVHNVTSLYRRLLSL